MREEDREKETKEGEKTVGEISGNEGVEEEEGRFREEKNMEKKEIKKSRWH